MASVRDKSPLLLAAIAALLAVVVWAALIAVDVAGDRAGKAVRDGGRPNIVWLMTDDQEESSLRVMPRTRALLKRRGAAFENSFVAWPLCCPSRATFLTGQHAHNHGVLDNRRPRGGFHRLDTSSTLPLWLEDGGYRTAHVGKFMNDYKRTDPIPPGWSEWYGLVEPSNRYFKPRLNENGELKLYGTRDRSYSTDLFTRKAVKFIRRHAEDRDRPFFLSLGYVAPHAGKIYRARGCQAHAPDVAPRHEGGYARTRIPRRPGFNERDLSDKPEPVRRRQRLSGADLRRKDDAYRCRLESLSAVDESVSEIVGALAEVGELDNTFVFFTSDNGYLLGEHRLINEKSLPYDESLRVPLLVRGPGVPEGHTVPDLVSNVDWAPTILDIAGVEPGLRQDGSSFLPELEGRDRRRGRALLVESDRERYSGVRTARYLYVRYHGGAEEYRRGDVELYDLRRDPDQLENLRDDPRYSDERTELERLRRRLRDCEGSECEATARVRLLVEGRGAQSEAARCAPGRATVDLRGRDAGKVRRAQVGISGGVKTSTRLPAQIELPRSREISIQASLELVDGRIVDVASRPRGCEP